MLLKRVLCVINSWLFTLYMFLLISSLIELTTFVRTVRKHVKKANIPPLCDPRKHILTNPMRSYDDRLIVIANAQNKKERE